MTASRFNFRCWDKQNQQMVYPDGNGYFKLENDTVITGNGDLFDLVNQEIVENCILMQSTGLKDKNGKEIYEGDIIEKKVRYFHTYRIEKEKEIVEWFNDDTTGFYPFNDYNLETDRYSLSKDFEVIGNIYENKEILGE